MRPHLNEHGFGRFVGLPPVPQAYLDEHELGQCSVCQRFLSTRFGGVCPRCRPAARAAAAAATQSQGAGAALASPGLPSWQEASSRRTSTKHYVPKAARDLWAKCFVQAAARAVHSNSEDAWLELTMLPKCVLRPHTRGGRSSRNAAEALTKTLCRRWLDGERATLWAETADRRAGKKPSRASRRAQRCLELAADAQYSKACAALTTEPPVEVAPEVLEEMRRKHPRSPQPVDTASLPAVHPAAAPQLDAAAVEKEVRAFPRGSAPGPSGLRPQHLKDALHSTAHRDEVLHQLLALVNLLAKGLAPPSVAEHLAGAWLVALTKKDGGLRPVAIGETLRRLVAKCLCSQVSDAARDRLAPLQVGVAVPGGCEAAVHVSRQWLTRHAGDKQKVFCKLDLSNAFNTLDRQALLQAVHEELPTLAPWASWCYRRPSLLWLGRHSVRSECGVQQGDPLGPLLFSLALQRAAERALRQPAPADLGAVDLAFFFLDDGTLAGDWRAVAHLLHLLAAELAAVGLHLSTGPGKCEVVPASSSDTEVDLAAFPPGFRLRSDGNVELLGAPLGRDDFCHEHTRQRVAAATELLEALGDLENAQVALHLLRQCAGFCRLSYLARVVPPCVHTEALLALDGAVRACFEQLSNSTPTDDSWAQAQLSLKTGGLGLRSAERHAPAAYVASRAACSALCRLLDPAYTDDDTGDAEHLGAARRAYNAQLPEGDRANFDADRHSDQRLLSDKLDGASRAALWARATPATRAHLSLVSAPGACAWLQARPCAAVGTDFPHSLMQVALQRRLRVQLAEGETFCPACGDVFDAFGDHALVCPCHGDRTKRHDALRNQTFFHAQAAGFSSAELERPGLLQPRAPGEGPPDTDADGDDLDASGRRPADVFIPRWRNGIPAALDFAVTSGLRGDLVVSSAEASGTAAERYEEHKRQFLDTARRCSDAGVAFVPMVAEAHGGSWGREARRAFAVLAKRAADAAGEEPALVAAEHAQRLSLLLHKETARAVLRRLRTQPGTAAEARLAAATAARAVDAA